MEVASGEEGLAGVVTAGADGETQSGQPAGCRRYCPALLFWLAGQTLWGSLG